MIDEHAPYMAAFYARPTPTVRYWHLPLVPQANGGALQGFIRLFNPSVENAEIDIYAYDETGRRWGPLRTTLAPGRSRGLNAYHLEGKTPHVALDDTLDDGTGHWRLTLRSTTAIEARAYTRTRPRGSPRKFTSAHDSSRAPRREPTRYPS